MPKKLLNAAQQRFVVQCLACFMSPQEVSVLVKENFQVEITRQAVECYDPTKVAGYELKADLRDLFTTTRTTFITDERAVGIANKIVRLRLLERLAGKAEEQGNFRWAAHFIKQAKDEVDGILTGKPGQGGTNKDKPTPSLKVTIEHGAEGTSTAPHPAPEAGAGVPEPGD